MLIKQEYEKYTDEDHLVWKTLVSRQLKNIYYFHRKWNSGFRKMFQTDKTILSKVPNLDVCNEILKKHGSQFRLIAVDGIVEDKMFFELISRKLFPVTTWIRKSDSLDYIPEPDMFHDFFGHVPYLFNPNYCYYITMLAKHALHAYETNDIFLQLTIVRLYWYTIEFGISILDGHDSVLYGSGIISSYKETLDIINSAKFDTDSVNGNVYHYNMSSIANSDFEKETIQNKYYQLYDELNDFSGFYKVLVDLQDISFK